MTQQHMIEPQAQSQAEPQAEPQLEPQVESQSEPKPETIAPKSPIFYQAVGLIQAELQVDDEGAYLLRWHDRTWSVYLRKKILDIAETLVGKLLYWRVYPHTSNLLDGFVVNRFTVVSQPTTPAIPIDGQFKLAGCWESLPRWQDKTEPGETETSEIEPGETEPGETEPARKSFFSVYCNPERDNYASSKSYNQHYALNWDKEPFIPGPGHLLPWHSILAKLQPDGSFDFVELIDGPKPAPDRLKRQMNYNPKFDRRKSNKRADSANNPDLSEGDGSIEKTPRISPPPPVLGKKATSKPAKESIVKPKEKADS